MESIWSKTAKLPQFASLEGDRKTDVLVIGGGMAGVLCAWMLREAGVDCLLLEAATIGSGVTENTTAKITAQHGLIYHKLAQQSGMETAKQYLEANLAALDRYRTLCAGIDCGYEEQDAYVYSLQDRGKLEDELAVLEALGVQAELVEQTPLPFSVAGAVRFPKQAQFHPLKFLAAIAAGLPVFEHTPVLELGKHRAVTALGTVTAETILVATHFPILNKHGSYFLKMYQHRSYVLALEGGPRLDGMYVDEAEAGLSFRNAGELLLIGGGDHRTGKTGGGWTELSRFAERHYPGTREVARWATQDCMTLDGAPYIGPYSAHTEGLYVATGFNKWGMSSSMVAAMLLTELATGKEPAWAEAFSPSRSIWKPQLAVNVWEAVRNLLRFSRPRCPHMGCALQWNALEHSWDCPCHGSRFTESGLLLDNPANGNLNL